MADYTLTADVGSFVLSGQAVNLKWGHLLSMGYGSFHVYRSVGTMDMGFHQFDVNGQMILMFPNSTFTPLHGSLHGLGGN